MILPYVRISPTILRPIIVIKLSGKKNFVLQEVLIDSGADYCIFDQSVAYALAIPLTRAGKIQLSGIRGEKLSGYFGKVNIMLENVNYSTKAIFSEELGPFAYGVLGQNGFFDHFKVVFNRKQEEIEIMPF